MNILITSSKCFVFHNFSPAPEALTLMYRTVVALFSEKGIYSSTLYESWKLKQSRTLLKSDQWRMESMHLDHEIRGAINFRNIPGTKIYALGQPTLEAMDQVLEEIRAEHPTASRIVWIVLREEPIVYVNSEPYCLRRERFSLRNMKGVVIW